MQSLSHPWADEAPTRQTEHVPTSMLVRFTLIQRLAETALERLTLDPDADSIAAACDEVLQICNLAREVPS